MQDRDFRFALLLEYFHPIQELGLCYRSMNTDDINTQASTPSFLLRYVY